MPHVVEPHEPGKADHAAPEPDRYELVPDSAVEPKTKAATVGAGAGVAVSTFLVWLIDEIAYNGEAMPPDVPLPVVTLVGTAVTTGLAFLGGYMARHVNRRQ